MNYLAAIIIPAYIALMVLIMVIVGRKSSNSLKDYALAGGGLPWFVTAGTIVASLIGGGTMIGYVGSYYTVGMEWVWMGLGLASAILFIALVTGSRIKNLNLTSVAEIFAVRYGKNARLIACLLIMIGDFAVFCGMISSLARILSGYVGLSYNVAMILSVVVFVISTSLGGFKGMAYTDVIQSILIVVGVAVVGIMAFVKAGGFSGLSTLPENYTNPFATNIPAMTMIGNVLALAGMNFVSQSAIIQKVNATRSPGDAKRALVVVAICQTLVVSLLISSMGLSARVIFGGNIEVADDVIVKLLGIMPQGIAALYASAIAAAILTTANAMLMSSGLCFANDILGTFKPDLSEKKRVMMTRIFVVFAAVLGYVLVQYSPDIITWMILAYTIQNAMIIPMYAGLLSKRVSARAGTISLAFSGVSILIWELVGRPMGIHSLFVGLAAGLLSILIAGVIDKTPLTAEQYAMVDAFRKNKSFTSTQ